MPYIYQKVFIGLTVTVTFAVAELLPDEHVIV